MRYRIVEMPEVRVVGRKARVPLIHEGVNPHIADHIKSVSQEEVLRIHALSDLAEPEGILSAIVHLSDSREEGVELDYYHAVLTSAEPPEDLDCLPVEAGLWAVFENSGPYPQALQDLWRDVFTEWFPSNPYATRPGPEILRTRPTPDWRESDSQLWIPVERAAV